MAISMETIQGNLQVALADAGQLAVYDAYDPEAFRTRADSFFVLGLQRLELQPPFYTDGGLIHRAFTAQFTLSLLMPAHTDSRTLSATLGNALLSALEITRYGAGPIVWGSPGFARQFQRMQLKAEFTLCGVCQQGEVVST